MTIREDILAELTAEPIIKIIGKPGQGDINILEAELAEQAAKIKTTEDLIESGRKYGFLVLVLGQKQYGMVIGNEEVNWTTPEDLGGYDDTIQAKDTAFDQNKSKKKHARQVIEYKKFLGVEESLHTLILQAVEEPYLETPMEEYIVYESRTLYEMISHLSTKISKVTNKDKVQLKKEVFIPWEQPQVLSAYFKQIE